MAKLDRRWRNRIPISLWVPTGTVADYKSTLQLPQIDRFWQETATVDDLRITLADGVTEVHHADIGATFDVATRSGTIVFGDISHTGTAGKLMLLWLYFAPETGYAPGASTATPPVAATTLVSTVELASPSTHILQMETPQSRATRPRISFGKDPNDDLFVWLDPSSQLERASQGYQGSRSWEEPGLAQVRVLDAGGVAEPTMIEAADMTWAQYGPRGAPRLALRLRIKGGASGNPYSLDARFTTAAPGGTLTHRDLTQRVGFRVQNLLET